jgi:asparagine synthase (glutamine-hydrolysing)
VLRVTPLAVTVQYPPPAPYYVPTALRGDADVVGAACDLIGALLRRWPVGTIRVGAEFSGGLDSAIIAAVLAQGQAEPLPTYALHVQGPARDQQKARRALAVAHFGFDDYLLDVGCAPAIPAGFDGERAYDAAPYNADLQQSLRPLLRHFGQRTGVRAVATGTGGDEVLMAHAFEQDAAALAQNLNDAFLPVAIPDSLTGISRERLADYAATCDRAPFPVLPISVLEAAAARAPLFMAHGMWLVSPFAQPEAVRFYRCLPQHVRAQKSLHRAMLRRLGYPEPFLYVPERENFVPYLRQSLVDGAPAIAAALRRQCLMHEMGLVDGDRFIRMVEAVTPRSSLDDVGFLLHGFNLEWMLRRVGRRGLSAPVTGHAA